MTVEEKAAALNLALPEPPKPVGNYLPAARSGNLVFTSGQTARLDGVRRYVGTVGKEVTPEQAYLSARDAALNCLACVKQVVGSLDRIKQVCWGSSTAWRGTSGSPRRSTGHRICWCSCSERPADMRDRLSGSVPCHRMSP